MGSELLPVRKLGHLRSECLGLDTPSSLEAEAVGAL